MPPIIIILHLMFDVRYSERAFLQMKRAGLGPLLHYLSPRNGDYSTITFARR
jgi:hypothetical protein